MGLDEEISKQSARPLRPDENRHFRVIAKRDRVVRYFTETLRTWCYYIGVGVAAAVSFLQLLKLWSGK